MVTLNVIPGQLFRTGANTRGRTFTELLSCDECESILFGIRSKIVSLSSKSTRLDELLFVDRDTAFSAWFSPTLEDRMDEIFLFLDADNRLA